MTPDPEKVRVWDERAQAYDVLCRRWDVFSLLSMRLIDMLPPDLRGDVLDIGAGSGLTSELLLDRHPSCRAILIEPARAMIDIARTHLAGRPLMSASRRHGFELLAEHRDNDVSPVAYGVDFMAMDAHWPAPGLEKAKREALLQRMRELAAGVFEAIGSTRFLLQASG